MIEGIIGFAVGVVVHFIVDRWVTKGRHGREARWREARRCEGLLLGVDERSTSRRCELLKDHVGPHLSMKQWWLP